MTRELVLMHEGVALGWPVRIHPSLCPAMQAKVPRHVHTCNVCSGRVYIHVHVHQCMYMNSNQTHTHVTLRERDCQVASIISLWVTQVLLPCGQCTALMTLLVLFKPMHLTRRQLAHAAVQGPEQ